MVDFLRFLITPYTKKDIFFEILRIYFKRKYSNTLFKFYWLFIHQLFLIIFYTVIFNYLVRLNLKANLNYDYSAYVISGLIPWFFFVEVLGNTGLINENKEFLNKKKFPFEVFFFRNTTIALINFLINTTILLVYILIKFQTFSIYIIYMPILIIIFYFFSLGISVLISFLDIIFPDVKELIRMFLTIGLFIAPIIYVPGFEIKIVSFIVQINPFTYFINCFRDLVFYNSFTTTNWVLSICLTIITSIVAFAVFKKLKLSIKEFL